MKSFRTAKVFVFIVLVFVLNIFYAFATSDTYIFDYGDLIDDNDEEKIIKVGETVEKMTDVKLIMLTRGESEEHFDTFEMIYTKLDKDIKIFSLKEYAIILFDKDDQNISVVEGTGSRGVMELSIYNNKIISTKVLNDILRKSHIYVLFGKNEYSTASVNLYASIANNIHRYYKSDPGYYNNFIVDVKPEKEVKSFKSTLKEIVESICIIMMIGYGCLIISMPKAHWPRRLVMSCPYYDAELEINKLPFVIKPEDKRFRKVNLILFIIPCFLYGIVEMLEAETLVLGIKAFIGITIVFGAFWGILYLNKVLNRRIELHNDTIIFRRDLFYKKEILISDIRLIKNFTNRAVHGYNLFNLCDMVLYGKNNEELIRYEITTFDKREIWAITNHINNFVRGIETEDIFL